MPTVYILVGVPGAGKSTWISSQNYDGNTAIISFDFHIERHASSVGRTYDEVFEQFSNTARNLVIKDLEDAVEGGLDIIWDQTNTTIASRRLKLKKLPSSYKRVAVVFRTPPAEELNRRLASRPGKSIPLFVLKKLIANMEPPSLREGFSRIINL